MSRKQALIRGTAVLTVTSLSTRFMGFFYRMFLSHTFGEENVGLYQLVFPVYALGISLSCAGMELALSRCVAREAAAGRMQKARELLKTSLIFTFFISCMISLFIRQNADTIALTFLRDSRCSSLLFLLSYTFPFASIHSCICGYSLGLKQTKIPAVSQLLEQAFRILSVIVICMYCSRQGQNISIAFAVSRPHIRRDCRFFLQPALHPAVLEADFRKKQKCFPSPCCILPAFTETSGTRSSTYRKPRILKYPAKCGSCLYPCLPPILRNAGCTIPADLWCSYRDGTSVYFISIRSYQCRFFHASADGSRASGNERPATTSFLNFKNHLFLHFAWMFLLWCSSDTREMDWNFSVQKSACRKFYSDTRMDLSVSVYEHCTSQHDQRAGKDHLFFSVQPFQPLHTDHRCLSFHPRRRNQRISERSADQPDIPVSLLHSPVICIRRQILTDFPHKKEPIHDIKHIFSCIGSFILHFCIFTMSSKTSL